MVTKLTYLNSITSCQIYTFKLSTTLYEVVWCEELDNGTTQRLCRKMKKRTVDFSTLPPTWGAITEIDIGTASGFANPLVSIRVPLGYDFNTDSLLVAMGEWNGSSSIFECTNVKLLSVKRDFSQVTVLHNDLMTLAKTVKSDIAHVRHYVQFSGYGGKIVGAMVCYTNTGIPAEVPIILRYNGTTWSAYLANSRYNYAQEAIEPIWGTDDTFYGWITEGHGTNCHFIKYSDLSVITCYPSGMTHTLEPCYDPVNHKILWGEWGGAAAAELYTSDPSATLGATNFVNVNPTGTIYDNEGNAIDLHISQKGNLVFFKDASNYWLVMTAIVGEGASQVVRTKRVNVGHYNESAHYAILANYLNNDKLYIDGRSRGIDPVAKLVVPIPVLTLRAWAT